MVSDLNNETLPMGKAVHGTILPNRVIPAETSCVFLAERAMSPDNNPWLAAHPKGLIQVTATLILLLPLLYITLQWAALARMQGAWQVAALLPAIFMTAALCLMIVGIAAQADFAAMAVMFGLPAATIYLIVLWPIHLALKRNIGASGFR